MEVGNVNSKHFVLALKVTCAILIGCEVFHWTAPNNFFVQVKSVLDPCEDENEDLVEDDEVSLGAESLQPDDSSTDTEVKWPIYNIILHFHEPPIKLDCYSEVKTSNMA